MTDWDEIGGLDGEFFLQFVDAGSQFSNNRAGLLLNGKFELFGVVPNVVSLGPGELAAEWFEAGFKIPCVFREIAVKSVTRDFLNESFLVFG